MIREENRGDITPTLPYINWLDKTSYRRPDEGSDWAEMSSMEKQSRHPETKKEITQDHS